MVRLIGLLLWGCGAPVVGMDLPDVVDPVEDPPGDDPTPGASADDVELRFVIPTRAAERVEVWLYAEPMGADALRRLVLTREGDAFVGSLTWDALDAAGFEHVWYGLRAWGPGWSYDPAWTPGSDLGFVEDVDASGARFNPNKLLWDPYGRELSHDPSNPVSASWGVYMAGDHRLEDSGPVAPKMLVLRDRAGDIGVKPRRELRDQVIYEVHVRALTMLDPTVPEALRGTYAGAALAAARLSDLGVTAVELLPVHETNNDRNDVSADASGDNYWGYSTLAFFAPDRRYAADRSPGGPTREFQEMVRAFHAVGISVYLDVVYNHTGEGSALMSWRGLDNAAYYELDGPEGYRSDNGVGPNLNATDPLARELVLASLRYWSEDMGVDGFRFDLAPILGNGCASGCFSWDPDDPDGILLRAAREIDADLIAEPWGATGEAYRAGHFPEGWSEWNEGFRDTIRSDQNQLGVVDVTTGQLAEVLSGSPGRYADDGRGPAASINYVASHDGFTLADQYRCNGKNNSQPWPYGPSDGGSDDNRSWDQRGDPVRQRRAARTGLALTMLSAGVPMLTGGDELLRSQRCNNNPYNLDSVATWIDWAALEAEASGFRVFTQGMIALRLAHPALRPGAWRSADAVRWYEPDGSEADGGYLSDPTRHAIAMWLDGEAAGDPARAILVLINGWSDGVTFQLPPSPSGGRWRIAADTHEWLEAEGNVLAPGAEAPLPEDSYLLGTRSVAVLVDP